MSDRESPTVVIADYDFDDVDVEREIVETAGFRLVAAQSKSEEEVIEVARDAAAIFAQYAPISARVMLAMTPAAPGGSQMPTIGSSPSRECSRRDSTMQPASTLP